jgi:hypothetical protein
MSNLIYTIPVAGINAEEFIAAFAIEHGWRALIDGAANPVSALEFSRLKLNEFIEQSVAAYNAKAAAEAARLAALAAVGGVMGEITTTLEIV